MGTNFVKWLLQFFQGYFTMQNQFVGSFRNFEDIYILASHVSYVQCQDFLLWSMNVQNVWENNIIVSLPFTNELKRTANTFKENNTYFFENFRRIILRGRYVHGGIVSDCFLFFELSKYFKTRCHTGIKLYSRRRYDINPCYEIILHIM